MEEIQPVKFKVGDHINMGKIGIWEIKNIEKANDGEYVRLIPRNPRKKPLNCNIFMNIENMKRYIAMRNQM